MAFEGARRGGFSLYLGELDGDGHERRPGSHRHLDEIEIAGESVVIEPDEEDQPPPVEEEGDDLVIRVEQ